MSSSQKNIFSTPTTAQQPVTLNDLRLRSESTAPAARKSTVGLTGIVLVAALAAGAFVVSDPLGMKKSHDPKPAPMAMAPAMTAAPPVPAATSQLAAPIPAPALAPAMPVAEPEPAITKPAPRAATTRTPAARPTLAKQRSTVTSSDSASNPSGSASPASAVKSEVAETPKPAATVSEAQGDSN